MYLTALTLSNGSRRNYYMLADCQRTHSFVMSGFPQTDSAVPRADMAVLYDVHPMRCGTRILIQSEIAPNLDAYRTYCVLSMPPQTKNISGIESALTNGMKLRFSLFASPVTQRTNPGYKNPIRTFISDESERTAWLARKLASGGAQLITAVETGSDTIYGRKKGSNIKATGMHWEGALMITDADAFYAMLKHGIGTERAYGMGMLMLQRI